MKAILFCHNESRREYSKLARPQSLWPSLELWEFPYEVQISKSFNVVFSVCMCMFVCVCTCVCVCVCVFCGGEGGNGWQGTCPFS